MIAIILGIIAVRRPGLVYQFSLFVYKTVLKLTNLMIASGRASEYILIALLLLTEVFRRWSEYSSFQTILLLVRAIIQGKLIAS